MHCTPYRLLAAAVVLAAVACNETPTGLEPTAAFSEAFNSVLLGYNNTLNSFSGGPDGGLLAWMPRGRGPGHGEGFLMGGGMGGLFLGDGFGPGFHHGRFGDDDHLSNNCPYNAASGRVACDPVTIHGLTITRSAAYTDANGHAQSAFDSLTTNTINTRIDVSGTATRHDSSTSTVQHTSDRTVSGLVAGSTQRTINGTLAGTETTSGTNDQGAFTAVRIMGDTTKNVVIPVQPGMHTYPIAGTVIRAMQATLTYAGQSPKSSSRREVVTYDGSATAQVVITQDGVTKNCTLALPHGHLTCQ